MIASRCRAHAISHSPLTSSVLLIAWHRSCLTARALAHGPDDFDLALTDDAIA
jgi:hypothetical protein